MLTLDYNSRISAAEAIQHPWIKAYHAGKKAPTKAMTQALKNLKNFRADRKLQQAVMAFITS
jgi:calcium-dependent protein kinase